MQQILRRNADMGKISFCILLLLLVTVLYGCSPDTLEPIEYKLAWDSNEKALYNLVIKDEVIALVEYTIEQGDNSIYKVDSFAQILGGVSNSGTYIDTNTFQPISTYYNQTPPPDAERQKIEIEGEYDEDSLHLKIKTGEEVEDVDVKLADNIIDNESVLMMVRNMALEVDYQQDINIAIPSSAQVAPYSIKVLEKETLKVPYGEYECYKVVFRYKGKGTVPDMFAWYTADDNKIMLKYADENVSFLLIEHR